MINPVRVLNPEWVIPSSLAKVIPNQPLAKPIYRLQPTFSGDASTLKTRNKEAVLKVSRKVAKEKRKERKVLILTQ